MIYKVLWVENKTTKLGKPMKKLSIEDPFGKKTDVNIFSFFPHFADIAPGHTVDGELEQNGLFWNLKSNEVADKPKPSFNNSRATIEKSVEKAQERTEKGIEKTMDRKEESIKLASAQRDAVLVATTLMKDRIARGLDLTESMTQEEIVKWRNWFLNDKDFNSPPPF
jgi:hypothetical protein